MNPKQALDFLTHWAREAMPIKHIDAYNQAFVALSALVTAADDAAKPKGDAKAE